MEKMNDLKDLLKHEIYDLHSAEEQITKTLSAMIQKANNTQLKAALEQHLQQTQEHIHRLERIQDLLNESLAIATNEKKGLLARLFKRHHVCKGMKGLIEEGESVIGEEMSPEVLDAAIIACAQKIEHYEICGYGTAKAFSLELGLHEVAQLLEQTLNEEYAADDRLTKLAVSRVNQKADSSPGKEAISNPDRPLANSQSSERSTMPKKEKAREMAPVSEQHNSVINKKAPTAKNKAPKGEAGRTETERSTVSESRIASNSKNSRPAKPSASRKTGEERNSTSKTKRSR